VSVGEGIWVGVLVGVRVGNGVRVDVGVRVEEGLGVWAAPISCVLVTSAVAGSGDGGRREQPTDSVETSRNAQMSINCHGFR
jgi:hypothetical protein